MSEQSTQPTPDRPGSAPEPALTGHAYDGILEYDNPTPGWWTWLFIATIVFSAVYFFTVTLAGGQLSPIGFYDRARLAEMKRGGELKADAATLINLSKDADSLKAGEAIYLTNCMSCHARDGSGLAGPNLTDDSYINITKITDIVDVVSNGRANGAMPAWSSRLGPNDIVQVSAYVASLRGQNKKGKPVEPNAKPIPPWSE
ncbi:cbb3-type cytochrome c oxidase N-terminal domain-containing protein [Fontivita pretiosa]|uniref:cbb3-type cytochrome c oxidase N-terminal domain-containing protein n=1 Tax=Fontivita pretiosa TaxID=2989684 RepID=UPI003D17FD4A